MQPGAIPEFGTVLCPIDLSNHSKSALYIAAGFAHQRGSRLVVLYADAAARRNQTTFLEAKAELDDFVRATLPGWFSYREGIEVLLRDGAAVETILAVARETRAHLIVMGTRGRGAFGSALLGSTAKEILRRTQVPVVVVPLTDTEIVSLEEAGSRPHLGIVLVPVDVHSPSPNQLAWAAQISVSSDHHLLMLNVVPRGGDVHVARERMNALAHTVKTTHGFRLMVREGQVADEVCHVVRHDAIKFIVLGRDATAPGRLAYQVLQHTGAAVVMVP